MTQTVKDERNILQFIIREQIDNRKEVMLAEYISCLGCPIQVCNGVYFYLGELNENFFHLISLKLKVESIYLHLYIK